MAQKPLIVRRGYLGGRNYYLIETDNPARDRVFDSSDGVVVQDFTGNFIGVSWADVRAGSSRVERFFGPKGQKFLRLLEEGRVLETRVAASKRASAWVKYVTLFSELRVVSAWQFEVVTKDGRAEKVIEEALEKHLGRPVEFVYWEMSGAI